MKRAARLTWLGALSLLTATPVAPAPAPAAALHPASPPALHPASAPAAPAASCQDGSAARVRAGVPVARDPDALGPAQAAAAGRRLDRIMAGHLMTVRRGTAPIRVPVYFHVIHDGPAGDLPDAAIRRQIAVLNATFGGRTGGVDTGFRFALRRLDRTDNTSWYLRPDENERAMKSRLHGGDAGTLNLYTADLGEQLLGWATFPWRYRGHKALDGVVVHVEAVAGGSIPHYSRGYSATHEIGHWLGLFHTFEKGCAAPGDRVADTPPEREPGQACPAGGRNTCPAPGDDPIHNFMDYSYDTCMTQFTRGQGDRMRAAWSAYRSIH